MNGKIQVMSSDNQKEQIDFSVYSKIFLGNDIFNLILQVRNQIQAPFLNNLPKVVSCPTTHLEAFL